MGKGHVPWARARWKVAKRCKQRGRNEFASAHMRHGRFLCECSRFSGIFAIAIDTVITTPKQTTRQHYCILERRERGNGRVRARGGSSQGVELVRASEWVVKYGDLLYFFHFQLIGIL